MKAEDLIEGNCYTQKYSRFYFIGRITKRGDNLYFSSYLDLSNTSPMFYTTQASTSWNDFRKSTKEEYNHFLECTKKGKYVNPPTLSLLETIEIW